MKTIKIAHLYYDLMNLNGESGNLISLKKHFENQKVKVEIYFLTIDDKIDFNRFDIYYMGTGSNENKLLVLEDIKKYKKDIKKAINDNKYFFMTGNSHELFGKYIVNLDKTKTECLNIFDYYAETFTDNFDFKIVGDCRYKVKFIKEDIIGFQNRFEKIYNINYPLFNIKENSKDYEGIHYKNFFGTFLLGPMFVRNPYLTDYFVKTILKDNNLPFKLNTKTYEYDAYREYIKNFVSN